MADEATADELDLESVATASGGKKKIIIIAAVAVIVLAAGVGGALFFLGGSGEGEGADGAEEAAAEAEARAEAIYHSLGPAFVVNFQGKSRARFLQVGVQLMTRDPESVTLLEKHSPMIRNNLVLLFSGRSYDDLVSVEGKEKLRTDALAEVQKVFREETGKDTIENLFFTSFVMQ